MGNDQSSTPKEGGEVVPNQVLQSPTTSALRSGALSPRQGSVCSETDVPYVSYTAHKPIGESPKKTGAKAKSGGRFSSPRLGRTLNRAKLQGTLVTVNKGSVEKVEDLELVRLAEIPSFLPVMQGEHSQDILARLNHEPLSRMLQRYEDHLRTCATLVAAEQGNINKQVREVDASLASVVSALQDRQKKYAVHCTKLSAVREVSRTLARCHMLLNENIDMMEVLNTSLPADMRLEPFVWTTG